MKKILILTVTAGGGHNACARGMKNKLESIGNAEVKIVDLLKSYSTKLNVWTVDQGYALAVDKLLPLYNAFYEHYKNADSEKRYSCSAQNVALSTLNGLMGEILEFRPDVIYCTHFYGAIAITDLRLIYDIPCKCIVSNLDYVNSPFWEAGVGIDYFSIPNEDFIEECISEGYKREQLLPIGLPVDERTLQVVNKAEAREKLGLEPDVFTVMVMFGGGYWNGGFRIFKWLVNALAGRRAQIIMINGKNEKSYRKISKMKFKNGLSVLNVGFTNDVPLYLSAADIILNKFGGTSVTEMLNKSLPMLVTEKLAAQEKHNLIYMKKKGVALSFRNGKQLKQKISYLSENPDELEKMSARMQSLRKNAIEELARFILAQPNADYSELTAQNIELNTVRKKAEKALKQADKNSRKNRK